MHFGENQLSPGLISLSLLSTAHPTSFQPCAVRASIARYRDFTLAMDRSPGFGSTPCNSSPCSDSLSLRLRLPRLNLATESNSLTHYAKGTRSPNTTCSASTACRQTVSGPLSLPSPGCFSPFPHGTCPLSVAEEYLALDDGPPSFPRGSTCPAVLGDTPECVQVSPTGLSPSMGDLSRSFRYPFASLDGGPTTPSTPKNARFGLLPVRSPLLRESRLISPPPGTEMFQFPGFAPSTHL